jgi:glycyl-tRNA synthetase
MAVMTNNFAALIAHCKEYGYIFQSSEIYDGPNAVYYNAQNGSQLKNNIGDDWWKSMTQLKDNIVGINLPYQLNRGKTYRSIAKKFEKKNVSDR